MTNLSEKLEHSFCFLLRPQVRVAGAVPCFDIFGVVLCRVGVGLRVLERRLDRLQVGDTQVDGQLNGHGEAVQVLGVFVNAQTGPEK